MSDRKMQVVFVNQTNHVLAAVTRTTDAAKLDAVALVGKVFPVHAKRTIQPAASGDEQVLIPATLLDTAVVDFDEDAFINPIGFIAGDATVNPLGTQTPDVSELTRTDLKIKLTGTSTVGEDTKVWAAIRQVSPLAGEEPMVRIVQGVMLKNRGTVTLALRPVPDQDPVAILPGAYYALILVGGYQPRFEKVSAV